MPGEFAVGHGDDLPPYHADGTFTLGASILGIPIDIDVLREIHASVEELYGIRFFNLRVKGILFAPDIKIEPSEPGSDWLALSGDYVQSNIP